MSAVPEFRSAVEKLEAGGEPASDRCGRMILRATGFAQDIAPLKEKPKTPRVFELRIYQLRIYHSPTWRPLEYPARALRRTGDGSLS